MDNPTSRPQPSPLSIETQRAIERYKAKIDREIARMIEDEKRLQGYSGIERDGTSWDSLAAIARVEFKMSKEEFWDLDSEEFFALWKRNVDVHNRFQFAIQQAVHAALAARREQALPAGAPQSGESAGAEATSGAAPSVPSGEATPARAAVNFGRLGELTADRRDALEVPWQSPTEAKSATTADDYAADGSRKGDAALLDGKDAVQFRTAEKYLAISERQRQKLMESGALKVVGQGHNRLVTVESLKAYLPPVPEKANRPELKRTKAN